YNADVQTVAINVLNQPYDAIIAPGLLIIAGAEVRRLTNCKRCCIVTDENVNAAPLHLEELRDGFGADVDLIKIVIPSGEHHKNLQTVSRVYDQLLAAK